MNFALTQGWAGLWRWIAATLLVCLFMPAAIAQDFGFTEPQFETVGDLDSIPAAVVTALAQDGRGLIWIGSQQGLLRYDGYRFRKFVHDSANPHSLAGDYITVIWCGADGRIWIGTNSDGLSVYDPGTDRFENFQHDPKDPDSLNPGAISALAEDATGAIWVATDLGLHHLPRSGKKFTRFRPDPANPKNTRNLLADRVLSLLIDKQGRLWVGSHQGLQRLSTDGKTFETFSEGQAIRSLFEARDGKLWVGSYKHGAAWLLPGSTPSGSTPPGSPKLHWLDLNTLSHPWIEGMVQVQGNQIWLASYGGGITIVSAHDGKVLQTLRHDPALNTSLALDSVKPLLLDRAGWLWIGTWGGGLQRINVNNTMLRVMRHSPTRPKGLSHPEVLSVLELANGQILMGTNGNGIDIVDRQRGLVGGHRSIPGNSGTLPDAAITALAQTTDGTIWAGTQQTGVVRLVASAQIWAAIPGLPNESVLKLLATRDGHLWVGTNSGVARWKPGQTKFEPIADEHGQPMPSGVTTLVEDEKGRVWFGTDNGLWLHEPNGRGLILIPTASKMPYGLVSESIIGLLSDSHARLWLATDKGLERLLNWDGKVARFEHISAHLGQPGKPLGGNLMEDKAGRIWTSDYVIDPVKLTSHALSRADGLDIGATWGGAFAQTRDGLLLFGGSQGIAIINPALYKNSSYAPPLVALDLKINGHAAPLGGLANLPGARGTPQVLTFSPEQRDFALEFSALDYAEPKKNGYQYRLEGYDKTWINADFEHRTASYGNLAPGQYTLWVRGTNRLGEMSEHQLQIPIRVLPAWWQTWWCRLLGFLSITGSAFSFYYWRVTRLRNIIRVRTAAIAAAHDKLASTHQELESTHGELAAAHQHLKETQTKLVQSEKMASLGGLVAGIAHEVNTPLGTALVAMSGVANVLQDVKSAIANNSLSKSGLDSGTTEALEYTDLALKSANRAADLIASFKTIAVRVDNDQSREVDLARYLQDVSSMIQAQLHQIGCQFVLEAPAGLPVRIVPDALQEALTRVFDNVIDHAFCDGRTGLLRLSAKQGSDGDVTIMIADDGHGIAAHDLAKVFDPFFSTRSGMGGHVGLGLHVAFNHVTQRLKGEISIASAPQQGTCVTIRLKAAVPETKNA